MKKPREKGAFLRQCAGCGMRAHKDTFLKITKTADGGIHTDKAVQGRSAYLCADPECLKKAKKNGRIAKTLRMRLHEELYSQLEDMINNGK